LTHPACTGAPDDIIDVHLLLLQLIVDLGILAPRCQNAEVQEPTLTLMMLMMMTPIVAYTDAHPVLSIHFYRRVVATP